MVADYQGGGYQSGIKKALALHMSAFDPKRTWDGVTADPF